MSTPAIGARFKSRNAANSHERIPTISVGAGPHCDGQLLVWTDWAGLTTGRIPKFVKRYADLAGILRDATQEFIADVASGEYPAPEHEYDE